jgi:hypothetical protein
MARGGEVTREKRIHATSDQRSEVLPDGHTPDAILHEVPLAFHHHLVGPGDPRATLEVLGGMKRRLQARSRRFVRGEDPRPCNGAVNRLALPAHLQT